MTRKPAPLRDTHLPILSPCEEDWDRMNGAGPRRHCGMCDKDVLDLSALTRRKAGEVLKSALAAGTSFCARYTCDDGGLIHFEPEAAARPGLSARARQLTLVAGLALAADAALGGPAPSGREPPPVGQVESLPPSRMGQVAVVHLDRTTRGDHDPAREAPPPISNPVAQPVHQDEAPPRKPRLPQKVEKPARPKPHKLMGKMVCPEDLKHIL